MPISFIFVIFILKNSVILRCLYVDYTSSLVFCKASVGFDAHFLVILYLIYFLMLLLLPYGPKISHVLFSQLLIRFVLFRRSHLM